MTMWRLKLAVMTFLLITGSMPMSLAHAAPPQQADAVSDLWIDISLGPPLIDWFNQVARPDDIARIDHVRQLNLLDEITAGRKLVVFKSVEEAELFLPNIADRIDIIGYNLENGPGYHTEELANPVRSVKRMHNLAQKYDLELAFGPDHRLALSDGVDVAPYVDIFVLQVQRAQTEPARVFDFVLPMAQELHEANPDIEVAVQIRTEGDVAAIVDLIDAMNNSLDGVSVLTSPETVDVAEMLVVELQTRENDIRGPASIAAAPAATRGETPTAPARDDTGHSCPLMVVGALIAGGVGGGLTAALICASRGGSAGK